MLSHLILETSIQTAIWQVGDYHFDRAHYHAETEQSDFMLSSNSQKLILKQVQVTDKTIAFVLGRNPFEVSMEQYGSALHLFHNYYFKNNCWNDLQINDLLQIQGEKRWQFNELLTRKIKAMKDEEIDCSNASAFITQVENRFMLTKDGVDFCFDSKKDSGGFAIVSFTWAELEGFLKMRI
jgi:hypothetical protein